jgi:CRISPR-associated protein Cmr1
MRNLPRDKEDKVIAPTGAVELNLDNDAKGRRLIRQVRKYELITPLFGGGVEPGVNDEVTPISGKAIRGHLRFWWRATRGGQFGGDEEGLRKMKECEDVIWGAASTPDKPMASVVDIEVILGPYHKIGNAEWPYESKHHPNETWAKLIYAAFPFQNEPRSVAKFRFDLKIAFPELVNLSKGVDFSLKKEIDAALWAWQTFGGLGARTRRGFGSLKRSDEPDPLPKDPEKIEDKIRSGLTEFVLNGEFPASVPHLTQDLSFVLATTEREVQVGPNKVKRREPYNSYDDAWEALIIELKNFRQSRSGSTDFGRSNWNEPERIREIAEQRFIKHTKIAELAAIESFSRAAFGQPILFQFHRNQRNEKGSADPNRDPVDTTLRGGPLQGQPNKYRERLASPLILRPLACGGTKAVGLAAILKMPRTAPEGMYLTGEGVNQKLDLKITKKDAIKIESLREFASALANEDDEVDVLEAFIARFRPKENKKK